VAEPPIGGGRPPRLAWGGSAIPRPAEPPPMAQGLMESFSNGCYGRGGPARPARPTGRIGAC
jgi:hypothetical protein